MYKLIFAGFLACAIISCNKTQTESEDSTDTLSGQLEQGQKKIAEKRAEGDTLALPMEELGKFLPDAILGFKAENERAGKTENSESLSWSTVEKKYRNGKQDMEITLSDYNGAYGLYAGAAAIFDMVEDPDNADDFARAFSLKEGRIKGRESFSKGSGEATVMAGINERFFLTIVANQQTDTEFVREVLEEMDLPLLIEK